MSTLLKIRGYDRGESAVGADLLPRGFKVKDAIGLQYPGGAKASLSTNLTGTNNDLVFTALYGGTYGNGIKIEYLDPSANNAALSISVSYQSGTAKPTITVNLATGSGGAISSTAALITAAVRANAMAAKLVTVVNKVSNDGTGIVTALSATNLSSGTDVGTGQVIFRLVNNTQTVVVDVDDPVTNRVLKRNRFRFVSIGQP